jgi:hypothetical protein
MFFLINFSFGQFENIRMDLEKYYQTNLQEKIFVHTDRSFYQCGEIIWFKVYLVNASTNQPLSLDKVAYVEILDQSNQPVLQGKIAMKGGQGSGSFLLPSSISTGNYLLRAYTNWMKNYSAEQFFEKNISIINPSKGLDTTAIHQHRMYSASFFPEGGNLVNGLQSTVAFKVMDNQNKGVTCKGTIVDQSGNKVANFSSFHFGMGRFVFTPEAGKQYSAVITVNDSTVIRSDLPGIFPAGYVMHVEESGSNDLKILISTKALQQDVAGNLYIIVQNHDKINLAKLLKIQNDQAIVVLPKDSLREGISQITVFNGERQPVCERLYFKRPKNKLLIDATTNRESYGLRSKIAVDLATTNSTGKNLAGDLSASVYRLDSLHRPDMESIYSYLWLSSDLRGYIEGPDYYFENESPETNEALDNLLLTQGWRTFNWENVFQSKKAAFSYVPEYSGHIVMGKVTYAANSEPAPDVLVYLSVPGKRVQLKGCISDSAGIVHFDMKDFYNVTQIVLQTNSGRDSIYRLELINPFSDKISNKVLPVFRVAENMFDNLEMKNLHVNVESAFHNDDLRKFTKMQVDSTPFYYKPDKTYLLDDYTRFTTMEEVMIEYVEEVLVRKKNGKTRFISKNNPALALGSLQNGEFYLESDPLVLLDGVPVFNIDKIVAYDPLKVQRLNVVASKYHWGPISADGILDFTTYKGNMEGYTMNPNDLLLDYEGLQQQRIFYSPDYSTTDALQSRLPDFRDVLYWSPDVHTDEKGKGTFSFYTGDIPGKYLVVVQGISSNGNAGSRHIIVTVNK